MDKINQRNNITFGNNNNNGHNNKNYNNNNNRGNNNNNNRQHSFHNRSFDNEKKDFPTKQFSTTELSNKLGDKLIGMMTDKEKNWVVNVQMLQLQIDDPYCYDFYYTVNKEDISSFYSRQVYFLFIFLLIQGLDVEKEAIFNAKFKFVRLENVCSISIE